MPVAWRSALAVLVFVCALAGLAGGAEPAPAIHVVFFTPSDVLEPPGVAERLTQVADAAERFFFEGMKRQGYPAAAAKLFDRTGTGQVEVIRVRGAAPVADPKYQNPLIHTEAIALARQQLPGAGAGDLWWIFEYLGPPPGRYQDWKGTNEPDGGGWALVNYDSSPGAIRPDASLAVGFNAAFALKGAIHELGHAFGLAHEGPDLNLGLGNSLMGANNSVYLARKHPHADQVYLTESSAALLWKHPLFAGTAADRLRRPTGFELVAWKPSYSRATNRITIRGRVAASPLPHSVIARDDLGRPGDEYWHVGRTARVNPDGTFEITIEKPPRLDGQYQVFFAFPNGLTTGDGVHHVLGTRAPAVKSYRFRNGVFQFGD